MPLISRVYFDQVSAGAASAALWVLGALAVIGFLYRFYRDVEDIGTPASAQRGDFLSISSDG